MLQKIQGELCLIISEGKFTQSFRFLVLIILLLSIIIYMIYTTILEDINLINIAIIDTGVNTSHPALKNTKISGVFITKNELGKIVISDDIIDDAGHGTAITIIIYQHNNNINIYVVRLFCKKQFVADEDMFLFALRHIYNNFDCDILNLSLGYNYCTNINELYDICSQFRKKGCIIVSAFDNGGTLSYPAVLDNVIGVMCSDSFLKNNEYEYVENSEINILAKGSNQRVAWVDCNYIVTSGSSFACAHITGILSTLIYNSEKKMLFSTDYVLNLLKLNAKKIHNYSTTTDVHRYAPISYQNKRAVTFPFNKEIHAIIRYNNLLNVELVDVYDIKQHLSIGVPTNSLLGTKDNKNFTIKNINELDMNSFELFILGHISELIALLGDSSMIKKLIQSLILEQKLIYSFEDISEYIPYSLKETAKELVFTPNISINDIPKNRFGLMHYTPLPSVLVCGTSSKQGKYSLQLELRRKLLNKGVRVGQIGTEPSAFLFGMDGCFHYGYNSSQEIRGLDTISYVNELVYNIFMNGKDIILSGCQSAMLVRDETYLYSYPLEQNSYLLGFQPDIVILCVNTYDEIDFIKRTIKYVEGSVDCIVLAIVLFPKVYNNQFENVLSASSSPVSVEGHRKNLSNHLKLPVYVLGDDTDMELLTDSIVDYFTEK